nr:MAG: hypothetical protein [Bacteriophage sp.]
MIKISGCCDGCGKKADRNNINHFTKVNVWIRTNLEDGGDLVVFDFCDSCIRELGGMTSDLTKSIPELQRRHGRG